MKRSVLVIVMVIMFYDMAIAHSDSNSVWGPPVIGGSGIGYCVRGVDRDSAFSIQFAGVRLRSWSTGALYACYQRGLMDGADRDGNGGKLVIANALRHAKPLSLLISVGALAQVDRDDTGDISLTVDGGISYDAASLLDIAVYGGGLERANGMSWWISLLVIIKGNI